MLLGLIQIVVVTFLRRSTACGEVLFDWDVGHSPVEVQQVNCAKIEFHDGPSYGRKRRGKSLKKISYTLILKKNQEKIKKEIINIKRKEIKNKSSILKNEAK